MPKSPSSKENFDPKYKSTSPSLTRRPIHKDGEEKLFGNRSHYSQKYSPSKSSKLYPEDELNLMKKELNGEEESFERARKEEEEKSAEPPVKGYDQSFFLKYIYLFFVVIFGFTCFYFFNTKTETEGTVEQIIGDMKTHFTGQTNLAYQVLKLALNKVVNVQHEPSAPAIIMLIANKGAENNASEFSRHLALSLAPQKYVLINDSTYWHNNPDDVKSKIDIEIKSKIKRDELNVVVVDSFQNIPFEAAMIFHTYCDHDSARFKRVVYLFIVQLNEILSEDARQKYIDDVAMKQLKNIWHSATEDDTDSLIARMTVSVINIR